MELQQTAGRSLALLDDDETFQNYLKTLFGLHGYSVSAYSTPGGLLDGLAKHKPALILLDLQLPHFDGWDMLKTLRAHDDFKRIPIVLVSGRYRKSTEVVKGLEMGADDYFTKPVEPEVMLARVEALLRRYSWQGREPEPTAVRLGPLALYPLQYSARLGGTELKLSRTEFDFLLYLVEHPNRVHTRAALLEHVWKGEAAVQGRTIDKYVETIRRKLGALGKRLETVVGVGYLLRTE